jgi:phage baseplate assembly protein gpV
MQAVEGEDGFFVYGLPELPENVIFNNGNGGSGNQTADLTVPADGNNCYHYADGSWSEYDTCQHVWNEGVVTKPATCTDNGELTLTCTLCAEIQMQTITATGHSFENGSCSVCGALEACTEHSWDEGVVTEEQTCWLPGTRTFTCVLCGATKD